MTSRRNRGRRNVDRRPQAPTPTPALAESVVDDPPADLLERWFVPVAVAIVLVAAAFRLPELALNPFHHDEGVNGFFTTNLVRHGTYRYDPQNYHGPSLYFLALALEIVLGLTTEVMRLGPAFFGILTVALVFALRRYLGAVAVLTAGALLAVSPGMVYVSRYFIHEMLVVAFSIGLFVSILFYLDRRDAKYLLAAAASASLLFATKETAVVTVGVLLIAVVVANAYLRLRERDRRTTTRGRTESRREPPGTRESVWVDGVEYRAVRSADERGSVSLGGLAIPFEHWAGATTVFLVIYILLFSSFFTNFPQGISDSFAAYLYWFQHGDQTQIQPITRYLEWMFPIEAAILLLGGVGGLIAAIALPSRLWVIVGLWALGITAAYSLVQYKTPWIIVNMLLPLALLAGLTVDRLWRDRRLRLTAPVALGVAVLFSGAFAFDLNVNRYDDEAYPYVFVHSTRDVIRLVSDIEATADRAGTGLQTGIVVVSPDYWPLPWYLRDYPRAGFYGSIVTTEQDEAMILANVNQEAELVPTIQDRYTRLDTYNLRPGVDLVLFVRNDVPGA